MRDIKAKKHIFKTNCSPQLIYKENGDGSSDVSGDLITSRTK
jgi:hypothetical protein